MNRKTLFLGAIVAILIVPQITFAAWWNPLSWFNNWSFSEPVKDQQVQVLENRIKELEQRLNDKDIVATSKATTTIGNEAEAVIPAQSPKPISTKPISTKPVYPKTPPVLTPIPIVTPSPVTTPPPIVQLPKDFRVECRVKGEAIYGEHINVLMDTVLEDNSQFEIIWDNKYLVRVVDDDEAVFNANTVGEQNISNVVRRKADGFSKTINCPVLVAAELIVEEEESPQPRDIAIAKLKSVVNNIYDLTKIWDTSDGFWICQNGDPRLQNLEYQYGVLNTVGAASLPSFQRNTQCSDPGLANYQSQLNFLLVNLQ